MPIYKRTKMCGECPFRAKAIRGWLGPWTPEQLEAIRRMDENFICHREVTKLKRCGHSGGMTDEEVNENGQHCVGMLRYMNGMFQRSRNDEKRAAQQRLKEVADQPVLAANTFVEYHTLRRKD
jgi:hypothetical protein